MRRLYQQVEVYDKKRPTNFEKLLQDKDDIINELKKSAHNKDASLKDALNKLDEMQVDVTFAEDMAAARDRELELKMIELESVNKQLVDTKQLMESINNRVRYLEDRLQEKENEAQNKSSDLKDKMNQIESMTKIIHDLKQQIDDNEIKLRSARVAEDQLKAEVTRCRATVEELERNVTSARAACDLQQLAAKNDRSRFEERISSLLASNESMLEELRRVKKTDNDGVSVVTRTPEVQLRQSVHTDADLQPNGTLNVTHKAPAARDNNINSSTPQRPDLATAKTDRLETSQVNGNWLLFLTLKCFVFLTLCCVNCLQCLYQGF